MSYRRPTQLMVVALVATLASASVAFAQQGRGGRGFGGMFGARGADVLGMLNMEPVQKELKLTDDQLDAVDDAQEMWNDEMQALRGQGGGQDLSDEQRNERRTKMEKKAKELIEKVESKLDATQKERLKQLTLQSRSRFSVLTALQDPDLQSSLKFTDEQKKQVETMASEMRQQRGPGGGQGGGNNVDQEARLKAMQERNEKALGILTADQKAELEKMKGPKFEFPAFRGGRQNRPA